MPWTRHLLIPAEKTPYPPRRQRSLGSIVTLADPPVPDGPNQGLSNCMGRRARRPVAMCDTFATDCTYRPGEMSSEVGGPGLEGPYGKGP